MKTKQIRTKYEHFEPKIAKTCRNTDSEEIFTILIEKNIIHWYRKHNYTFFLKYKFNENECTVVHGKSDTALILMEMETFVTQYLAKRNNWRYFTHHIRSQYVVCRNVLTYITL